MPSEISPEKTYFVSPSSYQLKTPSWFRVELCAQFPAQCWDFVSFGTAQVCVSHHGLCEFIHTLALLCLEETVFSESSMPLWL